ncbi:MAG: hypothetical protein ACRDZ8_20500 [Acidimicrobiales bacterium]
MNPTETSLESQLAQLAGRVEPSDEGWDQILARARRHDRRRREALAVSALTAVVLIGAIALPRLFEHRRPGIQVSSRPPAAPAPGRAPGSAAWVAAGQLWTATGNGAPRAVAGSSGAEDPEWSHDGQWISYLQHTGTPATELWVVHPDGTGNLRLWTGEPGGIEWSPTAELLAVSSSPAVGVGGLELIGTDGTARQVVAATVEVQSFAWSPDGTALALSEVVNPVSSYQSPLEVLTVAGADAGQAIVVLRATAGDGIIVGPWWPNQKGLLYWIEPRYSKASEANGLALMSTALSGAAPVSLGTSLVNPPWLTWAGDGQIFVVLGGGPQPSDNKTLELCAPTTGVCDPVPVPAGAVSLDPAVSPDGNQIAFVVAKSAPVATPAWYGTRTLWVADVADLAGAHALGATGVANPSFSPDGLMIGYSTATGVAAVSVFGGAPTVLSGPSALQKDHNFDGETAYGKAPWTGHAVWAPSSAG